MGDDYGIITLEKFFNFCKISAVGKRGLISHHFVCNMVHCGSLWRNFDRGFIKLDKIFSASPISNLTQKIFLRITGGFGIEKYYLSHLAILAYFWYNIKNFTNQTLLR